MRNILLVLLCVLGVSAICQNPLPQPLPCLSVDEVDFATGSNVYVNEECINIYSNVNPVVLNYDQNYIVQSGHSIVIGEESNLSPSGTSGSFHAYISSSEVEAAWFIPEGTPGYVGKYEKLEIGINFPEMIDNEIQDFLADNNDGLNPFDPLQLSIEATFELLGSSSSADIKYGFFYKQFIPDYNLDTYIPDNTDYDWRIRYSPFELGEYKVTVRFFVNETEEFSPIIFNFICTPSNKKGYITRSYEGTNADRYFYYSETGKTYHPIGHSISLPTTQLNHMGKPSVYESYRQEISNTAAYGANFTRLEIGRTSWIPNWTYYNNYNPRMHAMWEFDRILDQFADLEMYFLSYRHHIEILDWRWEENPFKLAFGLLDQEEYFSNPEVLRWQKNATRYMFSRWGYSANWMGYSYSEVDKWLEEYGDLSDNCGGSNNDVWIDAMSVFSNWMNDEKMYYQDELGYSHIMFTATFGKYSSTCDTYSIAYEVCDFLGRHDYGIAKNVNFISRYDAGSEIWDDFNKPFIFEEIGYPGSTNNSDGFLNLFCCTGIDFHNEIWSTSFMGSAGTGMDFWWDRGIHYNGYYQDYLALSIFFDDVDEKSWEFSPQRWKDSGGENMNNTLIENYALVSENQEFIVGWVHNATYYWRNIFQQNQCVQDLISTGSISNPCVYPDGHIHSGTFPDNQFGDYADNYSTNGTYDVENQISTQQNPTFKIKNLKSNLFQLPQKHWYQVDFYSTISGLVTETQILHTDIDGDLKPHVPNLNEYNPDWAYKIYYLGLSDDQPGPKSHISTNDDIDEDDTAIFASPSFDYNIYPNPASSFTCLVSNSNIIYYEIYDLKGQLIQSLYNINSTKVEIDLELNSGVYLIKISLEDNTVFDKLVIQK